MATITLRISSYYVYFVGRRRIFYAWGCDQRPQQPQLDADNPHAIRGCEYEVRFNFNLWDRIVGDMVVVPYVLPDKVTTQWYCTAWRRVCEARRISSNSWTRLIREGECTSRADYVASSVTGSNFGWFYSCEDIWGSTFIPSLQGLSKIRWQDFKQLWQRSLVTRQNAVWRTAICLEMDIRRWKTYCN
jgi:hypothetical protein